VSALLLQLAVNRSLSKRAPTLQQHMAQRLATAAEEPEVRLRPEALFSLICFDLFIALDCHLCAACCACCHSVN
jgi:hypothetical protein